jgi:myo-inositol-1(or 4)-monophosphatase
MDPVALIDLFCSVSVAIRAELDDLSDWGRADGHDGQYRHDVVADEIAVPMLTAAGLGVVSEESPRVDPTADVVAVIDPIDGSTNASMGLPWFATSICAMDADGPLAAVVVNQALDITYSAIRGQGAWRDGARIASSACTDLSEAIVIINAAPPQPVGWRQYRVLGAAALDMCAVADGTADGFVDFGTGLAAWDYLGALLVCQEAGASVGQISPGELLDFSPGARIQPVAAGTAELCTALESTALENTAT